MKIEGAAEISWPNQKALKKILMSFELDFGKWIKNFSVLPYLELFIA